MQILEEEWRRLPLSFAHEESKWIKRAVAVSVGAEGLSAAEAEGMIAYATKQADMYRRLAVRAEKTRTEPKLGRGYRRPREVINVVSSWQENEDGGDEDVGQEEEEEDDGFVDSDAEDAVMDGDGHDD